MKQGKNICDYLKAIRRDIAELNEIPLMQEECTFEGECCGTCPHCDSELEYLEREIQKRRLEGKNVSFEGIAERHLWDIFMDSSHEPACNKPLTRQKPFYKTMGIFEVDEDEKNEEDKAADTAPTNTIQIDKFVL